MTVFPKAGPQPLEGAPLLLEPPLSAAHPNFRDTEIRGTLGISESLTQVTHSHVSQMEVCMAGAALGAQRGDRDGGRWKERIKCLLCAIEN